MVVVHGKGDVLVGRGRGQVAGGRCLCDRRLVVDDLDNETTVVLRNATVDQVGQDLVGNCLLGQVVQEDLHGRVVREAAVLLVEAEEGGMQVDGERRGLATELAQNVLRGPHVRLVLDLVDGGIGIGRGIVGVVVGARVETGGHGGSRAAHRMSSFRCRRRRHAVPCRAECWP